MPIWVFMFVCLNCDSTQLNFRLHWGGSVPAWNSVHRRYVMLVVGYYDSSDPPQPYSIKCGLTHHFHNITCKNITCIYVTSAALISLCNLNFSMHMPFLMLYWYGFTVVTHTIHCMNYSCVHILGKRLDFYLSLLLVMHYIFDWKS